MGRSALQKLKLTYIRDYFYYYSDENHPITIPMIIDMLNTKGVLAERKSIYDDIEMLKLYGMDIISEKRGEYYLASREFELPELKLLVDTVSSSKFLTGKKSASLIKKLESCCSVYQAQNFSNQAFIQSRIKNMNESIYFAVDEISEAISGDNKIRFKYYHYNADKKEVYSKDNAYYIVSPFALLIDDEKYYLVAYDSEKDIIRHFRVDRMKNAEIIDDAREGHDKFNRDDYIKFSSKMFSMFQGKNTSVTMSADDSMSGTIIDRFGKETVFIKNKDNTFDFSAEIGISPQFYGWVFGLSGKVRIISPEWVKDEYKTYLKNELIKYE